MQALPRQIQWFFKKFAANGYAFEYKDADAEINREEARANNRLLSSAIVAVGCLLTAGMLMNVAYEFQSKPARAWRFCSSYSPLFSSGGSPEK